MAAGARRAARRRAVELVFEAFQRGLAPLAVLAERAAAAQADGADGADGAGGAAGPAPYTRRLVEGVAARQDLISEWLDSYAQGWPQLRMPGVDRAILYVGAYEVVFEDEVADAVAIGEAANLAGRLSTDKSAGFVSGLLGRLSKLKPTLV
ncbi:MAG: transcription antitermination protein NusB [Bifidobacteriaceae bacterium]|jgi:N utilization substance protein B|nr:transcription antitermination protein NusB [Bifidobacteriaceae bacterium]